MKRTLILICYINYIIALCFFSAPIFANILEDELLVQTHTDNRHYNQVCWLTSHNSFAYKDDSFSSMYLHPNQKKNIQDQLLYGVRGFMVDLHYEDDDPGKSIILAHKNDITGGKNYVQKFSSPFLSTIKEWLNDSEHQNDIITIHLESYIRSYDKIKDVIDIAGLGKYLFDLCEYNDGVAQKGKATCMSSDGKELDLNQLRWPTLREMREQKKRIVIFSDKVEDAGKGIMPVSNTMETKYDLSDYPYCEMRLEGRSPKAPIFIMNHFYGWQAVPLGVGHYYEWKHPNEFNKIAARVGICALQNGQWPNFIAFDNVGDPNNDDDKHIVMEINKLNKEYCCVAEGSIEDKHGNKIESSRDLIHDEL